MYCFSKRNSICQYGNGRHIELELENSLRYANTSQAPQIHLSGIKSIFPANQEFYAEVIAGYVWESEILKTGLDIESNKSLV